MSSVFAETTTAHQARIGISLHRVKSLRRVLTLKRQGLTAEQIHARIGATNATWETVHASLSALEAELQVNWNGACYVANGHRVPDAVSQARAAWGQTLAGDSNKRARAAAGQLNVVPFGYHLDAGNNIVPQPEQAAAVQYAIALLLQGYTFQQIAERLNAHGHPAPLVSTWDKDGVRELTRRLPVYAGYAIYRGMANKKRYWEGELFAGRFAPLLTWTDVEAVLQRLGRANTWTIVRPRTDWDNLYRSERS